MKKGCIVIPARIGSSRLPEKSIKMINGKSMTERVLGQAMKSKIKDIILATDDERIAAIGKKMNVHVCMTPSNLPSGTDRSYYAVERQGFGFDFIINLQGDLPNVSPALIDSMGEHLSSDKDLEMLTVATQMHSEELKNNPSFVKIVIANYQAQDNSNKIYNALFFSRSPIPYGTQHFFKHIGIYGYKSNIMHKFISLPQSPLEKTESLEQMRALENGIKIHAILTNEEPISVDTQADLDFAIANIH